MQPDLRIASPCSADWDRMIGDERVRHCPECKLNVYNFSAMPEGEIRRLVENREGRLCARWYRRTDGTMLTADCPVGFGARVRRISLVAGTALSAIFGAGTAKAQQTGQSAQPSSSPSLVQIDKARQGEGMISVRVVDPTGAVIPGAEISVLDSERRLVAEGKTNPLGEFRATGLARESYWIRVHFTGFATAEISSASHKAEVGHSQEPLLVTLNLGLMGEVVEVRKANFIHRLFSRGPSSAK